MLVEHLAAEDIPEMRGGVEKPLRRQTARQCLAQLRPEY